jgi:hypothetical protein
LFIDEPLIVCVTNYCFLVFNLHFTCFRGIAQGLPLCVKLGQPCGKFVTRDKRVLANLWQICHRVSGVVGTPLTNSSEGIDSLYHLTLGQRVLITLQSSCQRYWITSVDICKRATPLIKKKVIFLQNLWRN